MSSQTNTLYVVIDPSGAQSGAGATVNAIDSIIQSATQLNVTINQAINNVGNLGNSAESTNRLRTAVKSLTDDFKGLVGLVAAAQPVRILDSFIDEIVKADRLYNGFIAMMNVTTNDVSKSREEFAFVAKVARAYGIQIDSLTSSYAKLRASTVDLLTEDQTKKLFMSISAVSSVMHAEKYVVDRMFAAIVQMASKGQIHMEELKQQLGEHLPGALAIAAKAMNMSVSDMIKQMEQGKIKAIQLLGPLPDTLMKRFEAAAEISAKSLHASINRLKSSVQLAFMNISTNGAALGLSAIFIELEKHIGGNSEAFKALGEVVGVSFVQISKFIAGLTPEEVTRFAESIIEVVVAIGTLGEWIAKSIVFIVQHHEAIGLAIGGLVALRLATGAYAVAATAATVSSALLSKAILGIGGAIATVASFIAGYAIGTMIHDNFEPARNAAAWLIGFFAKLPIYARRGFAEVILNVELFGADFRQSIVEAVSDTIVAVQNMGGSVARYLGFDVPVVKYKRHDGETNAIKRQIFEERQLFERELAATNAVINDMYAANAATANKPKMTAASMLGIDLKSIDDAKSLYAELQSDSSKLAEAIKNSQTGDKSKGKESKSDKLLGDFQRFIDMSTDGTAKLLKSEEMYYNALNDIREGKIKMSVADIQRLAVLADEAIAMERAAVATERRIKLDKEAATATAYMAESLNSMMDAYAKRNAKDVESYMTKDEREYAEALRETREIAQKARDSISKKAASIDESSAAYAAYATMLAQVSIAEQAQLDLETQNYEKKKAQQNSFFYGFEEALKKYKASSKTVAESVEGAFTNAFKSMEDSLVSFLQTGKFNMTNFANSVIADILRIKVNAFMTQAADTASSSGWFNTIFGALLGSMGGGAAAASSGPSAAAGGGSWLGDTSSYSLNARSFDGGGYTGDGARSGGLDGKGGFWAMLHPQETVVDHTKGQTTGGDVNVSITVNSDGSGREESGDNSSAMQLGRNIESSVMSVIIREKRPGGLLS